MKLAMIYRDRADYAEARSHARLGRRHFQLLGDQEQIRLVDQFISTIWSACTQLGAKEMEAGLATTAETWFCEAQAIAQEFAQEYSSNPDIALMLAGSLSALGDLWMHLRKEPQRALEFYQRSLSITETVFAKEHVVQGNGPHMYELARSYCRVAHCLFRLGDLSGAEDIYLKTLEAATRLRSDRKDGELLPERDLGIIEEAIANIASNRNDFRRALTYYSAALKRRKRLHAQDPERIEHLRDLAVTYSKMGDMSVNVGDLDAAQRYYEQDLDATRDLWAGSQSRADLARDLVVSCHKLARLCVARKRGDEAKKWLEYCRRLLIDMEHKGMHLDQGMRELLSILRHRR